LQLLQANLDNGTAGGMSTRGFINTGNFTWFFHEDIWMKLVGPARWYNLGFIRLSNRKLMQYFSLAWFMMIWIQ